MTPAPAFSLSEGGRVHDALARAGLSGGPGSRVRRILAVIAVGWLPVALLAGLAGEPGALGGFLRDFGALARYLLVVPVAVLAEPFADRILGRVMSLLCDSGLVPDERRAALDGAVARTRRQATSDTVELVLFAIAMALPHLVAANVDTLRAEHVGWLVNESNTHLTLAGRWYVWVGLPLVEFLILRWLWRTAIWWRLLWFTARLPLAVTPAHPDKCAGLGFLALAPTAFVPFFLSLSLLASIALAVQIKVRGLHLVDVGPLVAAFVLLEVVLLIVPQLFFVPMLGRSRRLALQQYGMTGMAIARRFDAEWAQRPVADMSGLLDSPHASIMTDFATTYGLIEAMRAVPFSLREVLALIIPLVLPFVPLLLFEYSAKELLTQMLQLVR